MIKMDGTLSVCRDDYLFFSDDEDHNRKEVGRFSSTDYDAMEQFDEMFQSVGGVVRNQMLQGATKVGCWIFRPACIGADGP